MTEQQQKLYDKLLKKVNEYCLGAAAEDVITAIDALVESYETPKVEPVTNKELTPLQVWYLVKKYLNFYHHQAISKKVDVETVEGYSISIIENELKDAEKNKKALEIIKKKCLFFNLFSDEDNFCPKGHYRVYDNELYQFNELTKEEYELLTEVLK